MEEMKKRLEAYWEAIMRYEKKQKEKEQEEK